MRISVFCCGDRLTVSHSQDTAIGIQSGWGEGHDGEEVTSITYLLLGVQYCVPHRHFGCGQGDRNEVRTLFLQVFLFLQPVTHCGRMQ